MTLNRTEQKLAELNQPKLWSGINAFRSDPLAVDISASVPRPLRDEFEAIGRYVTSPEAMQICSVWVAVPLTVAIALLILIL